MVRQSRLRTQHRLRFLSPGPPGTAIPTKTMAGSPNSTAYMELNDVAGCLRAEEATAEVLIVSVKPVVEVPATEQVGYVVLTGTVSESTAQLTLALLRPTAAAFQLTGRPVTD